MHEQMSETDLPYYDVHEGNGPFLFLIHGFLSSRAQWHPNLERLKTFTRPVVIDLLAHGRSPAPANDDAYRVERYVGAFETIRQRVRAERWVVCGQSFGAGLAIRYALAHPDRTIGLVTTNSLSAFTAKGDPERQAIQEERIRSIEAGGRPALEAQRIYPAHAKRLPPESKALLVEDAQRISLDGVVRSWRVTSPELPVIHRLPEVRVPMLLVNGIWEKRFQPLKAHAIAHKPDLRIVDLEGGHSINMENSDGFCDAVEAFVAEACARP
jgi:pimeloyl-ACP methyl ester carboxylesterase